VPEAIEIATGLREGPRERAPGSEPETDDHGGCAAAFTSGSETFVARVLQAPGGSTPKGWVTARFGATPHRAQCVPRGRWRGVSS
jgi:hypothetical protein